MAVRKETDAMGEIEVPADKLWGAQTQRSRENFPIGGQRMRARMLERGHRGRAPGGR